MFRRFLLVAVLAAAAPIGATLVPSAANAACSGTIAITQFAFDPASIPASGSSTATLVAQNCTAQAVSGQVEYYQQFTGPSGISIPPNCVVFDPFTEPYSAAPGATFTETFEYFGSTFPTCTATGLRATVQLLGSSASGTVAQATANLAIVQTAPYCHVTYDANNVWPGGFTANVIIGNPGTTPINGWTLTFAFPGDEKITNAWNATVTQTGANVSATNMFFNPIIPAGGSQSFGFVGTWTSSAASPASFSVSGIPCT